MTRHEYESTMRMLETIRRDLKHYGEQAQKATSSLVLIRTDIDRALRARQLWQVCKLHYRLFWAKKEQKRRNAEFSTALEFARKYCRKALERTEEILEVRKACTTAMKHAQGPVDQLAKRNQTKEKSNEL